MFSITEILLSTAPAVQGRVPVPAALGNGVQTLQPTAEGRQDQSHLTLILHAYRLGSGRIFYNNYSK